MQAAVVIRSAECVETDFVQAVPIVAEQQRFVEANLLGLALADIVLVGAFTAVAFVGLKDLWPPG